MDLNSLMPKESKESDGEKLDSLNYKEKQCDVYAERNTDGTYKTILIENVLKNEDGECDIVLPLNENNGQIMQDGDGILANFRFTIDDNCNFDFIGIERLRKRFEFEFNDKKQCDYIEQTISKYCLNHVHYFKQIVDENDDFEDNIYPLDERTNPKYDKKIAAAFEDELKQKYEMSFIKFMADIIPYLILDEINNVVKLTLGATAVILGLHSFIIELLGDAGVGKSALADILFEHCIPDGYNIDFNSITEPAFISYCENNPRFFDGLIGDFGDLGDPEKLERIGGILDIYKILITEKRYKFEKKGKSSNNDWNTNVKIPMIVKSTACVYGSVAGDKENSTSDVKGQKQTRTLYITPMVHSNIELASFLDQINTKGTYGYKKGQYAAEKMKRWREFLKKRINQYHQKNIILVNPFRNMFNEIHKFSSVWIREYKKSDALLKSLAFINYERSIKIVKGDDIYVIPCIDDVKDFLKITADNIGLRVNERNLLLKLQKEFAFDLDRIAEIGQIDYDYKDHCDYEYEVNSYEDIEIKDLFEHYQNVVDYCLIHAETYGNYDIDEYKIDDFKGSNDKSFLITAENIDVLYKLYGLSEKNRKKNKANPDKALPILFFTASQVKRIFKGHNAIKNVANINETLNSFVEKGFLQKLTYKSASRNENVFYVEPQILEVKQEYEITKLDKIQAIAVLKNDFEVFDDKDIGKVCKDYKVSMADVENYIANNNDF